MDLTKPVMVKNEQWEFRSYVNTIYQENEGSIRSILPPPKDGPWKVPISLELKVDPQGQFRPFSGDTVVFSLRPNEIRALTTLQSRLLILQDFLAPPLNPQDFHLTLHDLSAGPDKLNLKSQLEQNQSKIEQIFNQLRAHFRYYPDQTKIGLNATRIYPCVNTSLVVGFVPRTDRDFRLLLNIYNLFDEVVNLSYWLRPHVTLAYFKPVALAPQQIKKMADLLINLNPPPVTLELDLMQLAYQHFSDMNNYQSIIELCSN